MLSLHLVNGDIPGERDGHSACVIGHYMYVFGGYEEIIERKETITGHLSKEVSGDANI